MKQKLFTLLLAVAASVGTMIASNTSVDGIWYDFNSSTKTATVTYRGLSEGHFSNEYTGAVVIPASVQYNSVTYRVTGIGGRAFSNCTKLTSVTIPESITSMGGGAFNGCSGLNSVVWNAKNAPSIAFGDQVTSFTIGAEVEVIPSYLCSGMTKLTSITIPNSVTSIGNNAFYGCSGLKSVMIGNSVKSIGNYAFGGCNNIISVVWNAKNCDAWNFGSQVTSFTLGENVEVIPDSLCSGMKLLAGIVILNSVTSIGKEAFKECTSLATISIPNSVTSIGGSAFSNCTNLASLTIGNSVTSLGDNAFSNCNNLTSLTIGNSVISIGKEAFKECTNLATISIPNSVTSIGSSAFSGCSGLTSVHISNLSAWCSISFENSGSNPLNYAHNLYLNGELIKNLVISNDITEIMNYAFKGCSCLTSINTGNSVISIGNNSFSDCDNITSLTIGNSVISLGDYAFQNCSSLTSVTIPNSVTNIATNAFSGCNKFKNIYFTGTLAQWCIKSWSPANVSSSYDLYDQNAKITDLTIPSNVTSIAKSAFQNCSSLTSVTIPSSVTSIGESAFQNCTSVTSVIIPSSVTNIGGNAFYNIDTIVYCGPATGAPWGARNGGRSIHQFEVGGLYYNINNCDQTAAVSFKSKEQVSNNTCSGCTLSDINYSENVLRYTDYNIGWTITCANIPDSIQFLDTYYYVSTIEEFAFYKPFSGLNSLKSVTIPKSVTSIGGGAFALCNGLTSVTCSAIVPPRMGIASWVYTKYWQQIFQGERYDYINEGYTKTYGVFGDVDCSQIPLYVPRASVEAYRAADQWKDFIIKPIEGSYIVTFQDYDGTELLTLDVMEDSIPVYKGAIPARPEDEGYVYTFSGWTPNVGAATKNTTYTATYTATPKLFTVTWLNEDGSLIDKTMVEYGEMPTHTDPTKAATPEFTYTFTGWTPKVVAVTGDATYTATYAEERSYIPISVRLDPVSCADWSTVRLWAWTDNDGSITNLFDKWPGIVVNKDSDGWWSYTFDEKIQNVNIIWTDGSNQTVDIEGITESTCYALNSTSGKKITVSVVDCSAVKNTYTIRFVNYDNTELLKLTNVEEGTLPKYTGATPTRSGTAEFTYTFTGWTPDIVVATEDATYTAKYLAVPVEQDTVATEEDKDVAVTATPTEEESVILEWPAVENADTYTITIAKNGEVVCTLVFDAEGRLISIAFAAPARNGNGRNVPAAEKGAKGWRYEVKGLEPNATYTYSVVAADAEGKILSSETIDFTMPAPQGIDDVESGAKAQKLLRDNQVLILRGEKTYTVTGQEVK